MFLAKTPRMWGWTIKLDEIFDDFKENPTYVGMDRPPRY